MDITMNTLAAMRRQEALYAKTPFLHQQEQQPVLSNPLHVDIDCRTKMTAWCFQVIDFCRFSRETAEIAMSYLDRFSATSEGKEAREDRQIYQLAAMSCLYTAVKIHEPEAMNPQLVSNLSRGTYSPKQIEEMEANILQALDWRMNPPTALSFVRLMMDMVASDVLSKNVRQTIYDLSKYQTELAVNEHAFLTIKPSIVAYCALMNAFESLSMDKVTVDSVGQVLADAVGLDLYDGDSTIELVTSWLYESVIRQNTSDVCLQQPACVSPTKPSQHSRRMSVDVSPRAVASMDGC